MVKTAVVILLMFAATAADFAARLELSHHDIARLKAICDSLARGTNLDVTMARSESGVLRPFLQPRKVDDEGDPGIMISHCTDICTATLLLRGGVELEFKWPNVQKRPSEIPITSIRLMKHGRTLYIAHKPFNQSMQPTANCPYAQ